MKKKNILWAIIVIVVILIFIILLVVKNNINNNQYLIIDNYYSFVYKDNRFNKADFNSLLDREYAGFSNKEFIGYYELYGKDENNNLYFTNDDSDDAYAFDTPFLFATSGIEVINYEVLDATSSDLEYIRKDIGVNIKSIDELNSFKKVKYDIDNDSKDDFIYYASYYDYDGNDSFSCIFLIKDNKFYMMGLSNMFDAYDESTIQTMDNYSLGYLIKIDNDIMMIVAMESTDITYYSIYRFDKDLINIFGGTYD